MNATEELPAFGAVDQEREHGIMTVESGHCSLTLLERNERGFPRRELARLPAAVWSEVAGDAQRELLRGMDELEKGASDPRFRSGAQALSPLLLRELAILFWALMEDSELSHTEVLLAGWRQLAREERWWLYSRASNPSQALGRGWRRALFFALAEPGDMRSAPRLLEIVESVAAQKKSPIAKPVSYRQKSSTPRKSAQRLPKVEGLQKRRKSPTNSGKTPSPTKRKKAPAAA
jgi:hypothetical protein